VSIIAGVGLPRLVGPISAA